MADNAHNFLAAIWSKRYEEAGDDSKFNTYYAWWMILGALTIVLNLFRSRFWAWQGVQASLHLHSNLLDRILSYKMSFFETTPMGRILNRFTKDFYMVDIELPQRVVNFVFCLMTVLGNFATVGIVLPWFFILMVPVLYYYYRMQRRYRPLSRDLQRIENASRSPIFSTFSEAVAGVMTVRAYCIDEALCKKSEKFIDLGNNAWLLLHSSNRWLQIRLDGLASVTLTFVCVFILLGREYPEIAVDAGTAGLMITLVQIVTGLVNWAVRMGCETEARITSVERIVEYSEIDEQEAPGIVEGYRPPENWPEKGEIDISGLAMRYREGLPLVLKDVTLRIPGGSKVGVAGRTGSGKSSLLVALFRLTEPCDGSRILIDGYDCMKGGLKDVRGAISIIPQDPVLFQGTVRRNLDPSESYSDEEFKRALNLSELGGVVASLDDEVEEEGANFSVGQRQLFCLARALLRKNKILVLDEATANVDHQTDEKLQKTLREQFKDCTVITIAHRLNTIADSDFILVMDEGRVGEFGSPKSLKSQKDSMWNSLLKSERGEE